MSALTAIAMALLVISLGCSYTGHLARHQCSGLAAIADALLSIDYHRAGDWLWALIFAALCAAHAYAWWNGGGGDDTRRRRRALARAFTPARRTAPSHA